MKNRGLYAVILLLIMYCSISGENLNAGMTLEYANFFAIINEEKYAEFSKEDRKEFEDFISNSELNMTKIKVKNPDNPALLNVAYLITYSK